MLEVSRVIHAGRHDDHGRIGNADRCNRAQVIQQHVGVVRDRRHLMAREQFGEETHHHLAVFQHIRHAGRYAQIVFQHVELALAGAHDIDAGDMRIDVGGDRYALHLGAVLRIAEDLLRRDDAGLDDILVVVNIVDEHIQRAYPLHQAGFHVRPFTGGNHARDDVERNDTFGAGFIAVDGEGNANAAEDKVGFRSLAGYGLGRLGRQPGFEFTVMVADIACAIYIHLVEKFSHGVAHS
ncbi:hypothetical protein D3C81_1144370 [compost metagenome]